MIAKADLRRCEYVFGLATMGGFPFAETGGAQGTQRALREGGRALDAFYSVWMPGNYVIGYGAFPGFVQRMQYRMAERRIARIARWARAQAAHVEWGNPLTAALTKDVYADWVASLPDIDRLYRVEPQCNSCGICVQVCPVDNIALEDGKPTWFGRCQHCLACMQLCPQQAIQYGDKTVGRKRYHHPEIRVREIMEQKEESQ